jgi:hypothetical protein
MPRVSSKKKYFAKYFFKIVKKNLQRSMAELFGVGIAAISKHLKNIYESQELTLEATVSKMEIVQSVTIPMASCGSRTN